MEFQNIAWINYIDEHITEDITPEMMAEHFNYSRDYFRKAFQDDFGMGLSAYISQRKIQKAARELRQGVKVASLAKKYGFKSRNGFDKAFRKAFCTSPSKYAKANTEVVDLNQFYSEYKDKMKVSFMDVDDIKMVGWTIIPNRGREVDIPAQIAFWLDEDSPYFKKMNSVAGSANGNDKIAMWYHDPECINIQYVLGPVVNNFTNVPDDAVKIEIAAGRFAVFETDRESDVDNLADTIRMFSRCVFYGWIKEHRDMVSFKDVIVVVSLLGTFYGLQILFPTIYKTIRENLLYYLNNALSIEELSMAQLSAFGIDAMQVLAICILPLGFISIALAVVATGVQTKFIFTAKSAAFKLSNLSIIKGIKNLFSLRNLIELLKGILKITILCVVLYQALEADMRNIMRMMDMDIQVSSVYTLQLVMDMVVKIGLIFCAIAGFDYFYQRWDYEKKIRMSKQELKEEFKQTEGNPEIKGKIRNLQRSRARNRMMQAVPDADVIIRNPTHFAVALKYDIHKNNAPILVAKGQDLIALKIVEIAEKNGVTVIENRPLARGIYATTPLDGEIPAEYYGVVAEILVQVFRKNKKSLE